MYCQHGTSNDNQINHDQYMFEPMYNEDDTFHINGPESFFEHCDDLELDHYDGTSNVVSQGTPSTESNKSTLALLPTTLAVAKKINDHSRNYLFCSLLDHGGSHVVIQGQSLPPNCETSNKINTLHDNGRSI